MNPLPTKRYRITHTTSYTYNSRVTLSHNQLRLTPATTSRQTLVNSELTVTPRPSSHSESSDFFGTHVHHFSVEKPHKKFLVTLVSEVTVAPLGDLPQNSPSWEDCVRRVQKPGSAGDLDAQQFVASSKMVEASPALLAFAEPSFTPGRSMLEATRDLMHRIYTDFRYESGSTTTTTPINEVMKTRKGVCQDFAHIAIGCLRSLKLPARYASGYLETLPPPGKERLVGADASHAWFSVYIPEWGWLDFDPTNDILPGERHVTVGYGRDFSDVSPLKGMMVGGQGQKLAVSVDVAPL